MPGNQFKTLIAPGKKDELQMDSETVLKDKGGMFYEKNFTNFLCYIRFKSDPIVQILGQSNLVRLSLSEILKSSFTFNFHPHTVHSVHSQHLFSCESQHIWEKT